jgi:hypothetical protein
MYKKTTINSYKINNIFKIIFFISFIDFFLLTIHRTLIYFQIIDTSFNPFFLSEFNYFVYFFYILICFAVFFCTMGLSILAPNKFLKINISKKTFQILLIILFCLSIFVYLELNEVNLRYFSGSIKTISGFTLIANKIFLLCLYFIYQLNYKEIKFQFFTAILFSSILMIDSFSSSIFSLSILIFEFFKLNTKKRIIALFPFFLIIVILILVVSIRTNGDYKVNLEFLYNNAIPRISVHAEQLFSYLSEDLKLSDYSYTYTIISESFNNRLKFILNSSEPLFYPKTIGQAMVFDLIGPDAHGGSSPGYLLSAISFFPFTLPLIFILATFIKQFSSRIGYNINFIQIACFCFLIKTITSDLLDMLSIISINLTALVLISLSSYINIKIRNTKLV